MEEVLEKKKKINNKTIRFSSAPWYNPGLDIFIGGAGGIGSYLSFFLARQEANLFIFDYDEVDETNLGGQFYKESQIGKTKAGAVRENIIDFCAHNQVDLMGKYDEESMSNSIVFSAFDNMGARKLMFEKWVDHIKDSTSTGPDIFIDGRMNAEIGQVYFVTSDRIDAYRATLFEDSEVQLEDCSYKATSHCGALIASLMVSGFNNFITNWKCKADLRDVPFNITYELPLLNFNVK